MEEQKQINYLNIQISELHKENKTLRFLILEQQKELDKLKKEVYYLLTEQVPQKEMV